MRQSFISIREQLAATPNVNPRGVEPQWRAAYISGWGDALVAVQLAAIDASAALIAAPQTDGSK
jgi:hypothetical protein